MSSQSAKHLRHEPLTMPITIGRDRVKEIDAGAPRNFERSDEDLVCAPTQTSLSNAPGAESPTTMPVPTFLYFLDICPSRSKAKDPFGFVKSLVSNCMCGVRAKRGPRNGVVPKKRFGTCRRGSSSKGDIEKGVGRARDRPGGDPVNSSSTKVRFQDLGRMRRGVCKCQRSLYHP